MSICEECGVDFNPAKSHGSTKFLCSECSGAHTPKYQGSMMWSHKTASEIMIVDSKSKTIKHMPDLATMYRRK